MNLQWSELCSESLNTNSVFACNDCRNTKDKKCKVAKKQ